MILTESKACTNMCPYIKDNCVGSQCMAWRWAQEGVKDDTPKRIKTGLIGEDVDKAKMLGYIQEQVTDTHIIWKLKGNKGTEGEGYCGLAGAPLDLVEAPAAVGGGIPAPAARKKGGPAVVRNDEGQEFDIDLIKKMAGD